jgi:hypothetical protein
MIACTVKFFVVHISGGVDETGTRLASTGGALAAEKARKEPSTAVAAPNKGLICIFISLPLTRQ